MTAKQTAKAQKMINEITAFIIQNNGDITPPLQIKLDLLKSVINDFLCAQKYIKNNGYITTFNKGTSIGLSPILKLKYDSLKQIRKLLKDIFDNKLDTEKVDDFIENLCN